MWNHFIEVRIIPSRNTSEVNKERALYLYSIMEDIPFDVGETIKTSILMNIVGKHNLGHPTLIFKLCKKARVSFTPLEEKTKPPIGIIVRKDESHND